MGKLWSLLMVPLLAGATAAEPSFTVAESFDQAPLSPRACQKKVLVSPALGIPANLTADQKRRKLLQNTCVPLTWTRVGEVWLVAPSDQPFRVGDLRFPGGTLPETVETRPGAPLNAQMLNRDLRCLEQRFGPLEVDAEQTGASTVTLVVRLPERPTPVAGAR